MLKIENVEIKMWDKSTRSEPDITIGKYLFQCATTEQQVFSSEIYIYKDISVITNRQVQYGQQYYNMAFYNEAEDKAWPLVMVPAKFDTCVKRLSEDMFFVWTNESGKQRKKKTSESADMLQASFCRFHPSNKTDNVTLYFNKLHDLHFVRDEYVLIAFSQIFAIPGKKKNRIVNSLLLYTFNGKLERTIYEYDTSSDTSYEYVFDSRINKLIVTQSVVGEKSSTKNVINLS